MKSEMVKMRVSVEIKESLQKAADVSGVSLSSWARDRLVRAAILELKEAGQKIPHIQLMRGKAREQ